MPAVTALVTLHREGPLAHRTLSSVLRCCDVARRAGLEVDVVLTLDRADSGTEQVALTHPIVGEFPASVLQLAHGDLSLSRNSGVAASRADCIAVFDGDDHLSPNWILAAYEALKERGERAILHPELIATFGSETVFWAQPDQVDAGIGAEQMLGNNPWNACCFARRDAFVAVPYEVSRPGESGFGFEDWHWNCETMAAGYAHRIVPGTVRFERRKVVGSLNQAHRSAASVIRPSRLFARKGPSC